MSKRNTTALVFFALSMIALVIITVFSGSILVDGFQAAGSGNSADGFGVAIGLVIHITYGAIGYGISLIFGIVATAVAKGKARIAYVLLGIVLPLVLYFGGIGLFQLAADMIGTGA